MEILAAFLLLGGGLLILIGFTISKQQAPRSWPYLVVGGHIGCLAGSAIFAWQIFTVSSPFARADVWLDALLVVIAVCCIGAGWKSRSNRAE